jgi:hypothetical protein
VRVDRGRLERTLPQSRATTIALSASSASPRSPASPNRCSAACSRTQSRSWSPCCSASRFRRCSPLPTPRPSRGAWRGHSRCIDTGHTRLLVLRDGRPVGVLHVNDLARTLRCGGGEALIDLVRPATMVPETRRLDDLLADVQRDRASMAIVVDEYGRTSGIVTVEDIVEEVVGEITDETDAAVAAIRTLPDGALFVRGHAPLDDLADHDVRLPSPPDGVVSVGSWVFQPPWPVAAPRRCSYAPIAPMDACASACGCPHRARSSSTSSANRNSKPQKQQADVTNGRRGEEGKESL